MTSVSSYFLGNKYNEYALKFEKSVLAEYVREVNIEREKKIKNALSRYITKYWLDRCIEEYTTKYLPFFGIDAHMERRPIKNFDSNYLIERSDADYLVIKQYGKIVEEIKV